MRALFLILAMACGGSEPAPVAAAPAAPVVDQNAPPAFTNAEGKLVCPVMGDVIESPDKAAGFVDHEGKRYYFCCNSCEVAFRDAPELYADGAFLKDEGIIRGGESTCGPSGT